ncbi:MAG: hypothetical protein Q8L69_16340, partial [Gallionellaceae bacterium]|nr:hypothetical protein [Gallionellaceae bacterium]
GVSSATNLHRRHSMMGISKNSEFAQMQGAKKICEHPLRGLPAYPASPRRIWVICKQEIFYATRQLGYNEVAV